MRYLIYHLRHNCLLPSSGTLFNTSSSDFKSKSIKVIVRPRRKHAKVLLRSINFHNVHVIDSLHDDQEIDVPLTVCCLNVQSLRNKAISVTDYVVSQGIDVLALY